MKKFNLAIIAALSLFANYVSAQSSNEIESFVKSQNLSIEEFGHQLLSAPNAQVLDARTPSEYAINHVKGAINVNLKDSAATAQIIAKLDKNAPTFTYSIGAGRSVILAKKLKELGFKNAYFMPGGIGTWVGAGFPLESTVDPAKATSLEEYNKLVAAQPLTFVDISSIHCGGCKKLHPILDELEKKYPNIKILRYEMDENLQLVKDLSVQALPTLYLYKDGKIVWQHLGTETKEALEKLFSEQL